jgi:hypothetical protein
MAVSAVQHDWLSDVVVGYDSDPATTALLSQLVLEPDARPPYTLCLGHVPLQGLHLAQQQQARAV